MMFLSAFQAHRKMVTVSIANIANDAIISAAIILMIPSFPSVITALVLTVLVSVINLGILIRVYYGLVGPPKFQVDIGSWRLMLREGTPIALGALGISTYTFIGPTVLKYYRGETEVGLYSAGYRIVSILTLIPVAFTQVIFPIFSDFYANAKHKLEKALGDSLRVISIVSIPLATGAVLLAPKIFSLLYTEQFLPGMIVLQVAIVGNVFGYMDWVMYSFLLATNRQVFSMIVSVSVGVSVFLASLLLVPHYGFVSLPYLQAATEASLFVIQLFFLIRIGYHGFHTAQLIKPACAAAMMGAAIFLLRDLNLFMLVGLGATLYSVVLYLLKGLGEQEMSIINRLIARS
jgi:O-antigen/teichoic acid export membrane protein